MQGVRSFANSAQAVQGWDSQTGGEITIGAAADRGLIQLPSEFARDGSVRRVQGLRLRQCVPWAGD